MKLVLFVAMLTTALLSSPAFTQETDPRLHADGEGWKLEKATVTDPQRPRVLLIGDSILSGYNKDVIKALDGRAYVDVWITPLWQSELLNKTLADVLTNGPYDVVHFNMGLHGWPEGRIKEGTFEPLTKDYIEVIRQKLPDAKILWASSTPIMTAGKPSQLDPKLNAVIIDHNRMAAKVMAEMNVPVNDFYSLLVPDHLDLARGDIAHWTPPAYKILADAAVASILKALPAQEKTGASMDPGSDSRPEGDRLSVGKSEASKASPALANSKNTMPQQNDRPKQPNIVLILTDQHHAQYMNCLGRSELKTPNLDKLAADSAVFRSAYCASPVCGPSRAAMLTGQYPLQNGIVGNWIPIKDESRLLTQRLAKAGYYNAMIGKLHLSPVKNDHGFDFRRMCDSPHDVYDKEEIEENDYLPWAAKAMGISPEKLAALAGESERLGPKDPRFWLGWSWADDAHQVTTWVGNEAVSFIDNYEKPQPFFLHVSFFGPHHPYATAEPWDSMYDPAKVTLPPTFGQKQPGQQKGFRPDWPEAQWREMIAKYSGNISAIDVQIGRITAALKARGMWDNTLIIFTSDHGDHMGDFSQIGKGTMLESSVRVPFFIKAPGPDPAKRECSEVVSLVDIYPTVLDYAGVANAEDAGNSRSIRRVLTGDKTWRNQTFASLCSPDARDGQVMMINEKFKAVGFLKDGQMTVELYDRTDKVPDTRNLADDPAHAGVVKEMQAALETWIAGGSPNQE